MGQEIIFDGHTIDSIYHDGTEIQCVNERDFVLWCAAPKPTVVRNTTRVSRDFVLLSSNESDLNTTNIDFRSLFDFTGAPPVDARYSWQQQGLASVKISSVGDLFGTTPSPPHHAPHTTYAFQVKCEFHGAVAYSEVMNVRIVPYGAQWLFRVAAINGAYNNAWQYPTIVEMEVRRSPFESHQWTWGTDTVRASDYYPPHNGAKVFDGSLNEAHSWIGNNWLQNSTLHVSFALERKAIEHIIIKAHPAASNIHQLQRDRYPTAIQLWYQLDHSGHAHWIEYGTMQSPGAWVDGEVRTFTF